KVMESPAAPIIRALKKFMSKGSLTFFNVCFVRGLTWWMGFRSSSQSRMLNGGTMK
ncbi:hypothetical protein A2U01_0028176, partial [Trifolium medium]|nr:hypothetical protein [Trifolium medium]